MKKLLLLGLVIIFTISLSSCASILNGKHQDVTFRTNSEDSEVYLNGKLTGEGKAVTAPLERNSQIQQVRVERKGFKDQNFVVFQERKSPLYILSVVPFGVLFYPPFADMGPKSYDYKKEHQLKRKDQKITSRNEGEKYVYIKNTSFNLDLEDFQVKVMKGKHYIKGKDKTLDVNTNEEKIEMNTSVFSEDLHQLLIDYNYTDTTGTILKKNNNSLYINASVENVELLKVVHWEARNYQNYNASIVNIDWELTDIYGQSIFTKSVEGNSGEFKVTGNNGNDAAYKSISDGVTSSFLRFINAPEFRKFMTVEEEKEVDYEYISLKRAEAPNKLPEAMQASVTVETDLGHGSGFAVSADGYILTNFHVIANAKTIKVYNDDGSFSEAEVVRTNETKDLALLKIDREYRYAFSLSKDKNYLVGDEIYVIGTPNSVKLGQSLSRGIVSGERNNDSDKYIQTDASINSGNSGGPLVNTNGELVGVVNAKLSGVGIEGIAFAIPGFEIGEALFIK